MFSGLTGPSQGGGLVRNQHHLPARVDLLGPLTHVCPDRSTSPIPWPLWYMWEHPSSVQLLQKPGLLSPLQQKQKHAVEVNCPHLQLPHPVEFAGTKSAATGWNAARLGLEIALSRGSHMTYRLMELQPV